ncbi:MAG: N-acetylglucosamine-6-phosphate deacetylase [Anaerolineae bacterium]|nr:N-acetylglucosamine-6-phosphate deacetylase [Anaerolineae bacterium]
MSDTLLIHNAVLITPTSTGQESRGWLLCRDGKIAGIGYGAAPAVDGGETINADGLTLLPGFIDVHVHGGMGHEAMDADPDGLRAMARFYAAHGVTAFLATTWTDSAERITAALDVIAELIGPQPDGATLLGVHLEGPYLNPAKCGAQSTVHIRRAARDEALRFLDMDVIRLLALAPEYPENHWLITECVRRGIAVSAAHTAATYDEMQTAIRLGLTQATHTYNAMTGLHHRDPGVVGAALTSSAVYCELIADNIHVHPAAMQVLFAAKGSDGVILITDAMRGAGMPDGSYPIDDRTVMVRDGAVRLPDGTLAGSTLTMDRALTNALAATGQPLAQLWQSASLNPARAIHVADRKGSLDVGKDADLVLVDIVEGAITVRLTVAEGRIVYRAGKTG